MKSAMAVPTSTVARNALVMLAAVAGGAALFWLRDILTPLAMAIFLLIMIDGIKRFVADNTVLSDRMAGVAALVLVILGFFASIGIIVNGATGFFGEASGVSTRLGPRIDQVIRDLAALFGVDSPPTAMDLIGDIDLRSYVADFALQVQNVASGAFFVLVYLAFLIAAQAGFQRKIVGMFPCAKPGTRRAPSFSASDRGSKATSGCRR